MLFRSPLLDGVSMQGAKGVIISIIGGEDMKLLEVDEAANHIRELVDPNANIIWGSAFNPDLQGKIRVSVVATGIEQTAEMAEEASRPFALSSASRGPAIPAAKQPITFGDPEPEPAVEAEPEPAPTTSWHHDPDHGVAHPAEDSEHAVVGATGGFTGEPDEGDADSDETAAAVAGDEAVDDALDLRLELDEGRAEEESEYGEEEEVDEADEEGDGGYASLERLSSFGRRPASDDLLETADRLNEEDEEAEEATPRIARGLGGLGGGAGKAGAGGGSVAGATLFERMANLSRGGRPADPEEDEEDDSSDGGGALNIPRFLGRQNNQ